MKPQTTGQPQALEAPTINEPKLPTEEVAQEAMADRARAVEAINRTRDTLGRVASVDPHGVVLTPREISDVANGATDSKE